MASRLRGGPAGRDSGGWGENREVESSGGLGEVRSKNGAGYKRSIDVQYLIKST